MPLSRSDVQPEFFCTVFEVLPVVGELNPVLCTDTALDAVVVRHHHIPASDPAVLVAIGGQRAHVQLDHGLGAPEVDGAALEGRVTEERHVPGEVAVVEVDLADLEVTADIAPATNVTLTLLTRRAETAKAFVGDVGAAWSCLGHARGAGLGKRDDQRGAQQDQKQRRQERRALLMRHGGRRRGGGTGAERWITLTRPSRAHEPLDVTRWWKARPGVSGAAEVSPCGESPQSRNRPTAPTLTAAAAAESRWRVSTVTEDVITPHE